VRHAVWVRSERIDFLVSYAGSKRARAEWVAWQLKEDGGFGRGACGARS
jgi:hypothetical protein